MPNAQLSLIASAVLFLLSLGTASFGAAPSQDVMGGASLIFIARPKNPPVRPKSTRAKEQQPSQPNSTDKPTNSNGNPAANGEMSDEVEDALALGNSARDAEPPRYQDAEKAYRLATKLNDRDPRPYLGLANLWYDQKNYEAAAKMYREATERMKPKKSPIMGAFGIKTTGASVYKYIIPVTVVINDRCIVDDRNIPASVHAIITYVAMINITTRCKTPIVVRWIIITKSNAYTDTRAQRSPTIIITTCTP